MEPKIIGGAFPVAECVLEQGEQMITEGGSMVWMSSNMRMETTGSGGLGRLFSGEKIFQNIYTAEGGKGLIAFGASFPGRILMIDVSKGDWIFQKSAFLACEPTVSLSVEFRQKLTTGLFGGEGFIMQRLSGSGIAFVEIDGETREFQLGAGEKIVVDTGNVAGFEAGVQMEISQVKGAKNVFFGGEGLFHTVLTGPGRVILQTMPVSTVAGSILPYIPVSNNK